MSEAHDAAANPPRESDGNHDELAASLARLLVGVWSVVKGDPGLRHALRDIAVRLTDLAQEPEPDIEPGEARLDATEPAIPSEMDPPEPIEGRIASALAQRERERAWSAPADDDRDAAPLEQRPLGSTVPADGSGQSASRLLARLAADAAMKAEAARWVGERQRRLARRADWATEIEPGDREIMHRAQVADVYLWMIRRDAPVPANPAAWDVLAGNFEALSEAVKLVEFIESNNLPGEHVEAAMRLVATAQSALRLAVHEIAERVDETQRDAFQWLRDETDMRRIYLDRHMRLNDPADPRDWGRISERVADLEDEVRREIETVRQRRKQWGRLRYHFQRIRAGTDGDVGEDWEKALDAIDLLVESGIPPSSIELRDAIVPFVDEVPDEVNPSPRALLALREVDRYLVSFEAETEAKRDAGSRPIEAVRSDEEQQVFELLHDRVLVLIGGIQRRLHTEAIERAFGLSELVWLDGSVASYTHFEPAIARPDVAAVVLLIRWSSHGYGDVKLFCDAHGKPLIRVPAGYNPRQLAHHILGQAGGLLTNT